MKVLVTGGDGMLGSNLVRMLLDANYTVSVFLHPNTKSKTLEGLPLTTYYGDILKPETIDIAIKNQDIVIHTAASTSVFPSRSELVRKINIEGTKNIIDKVLQHDVKKLIYIGSASSVNTTPSENSKYIFPGAKFKLDYIDSKYFALQEILKAVKERNLTATAILPTFMIGAYDSAPGSGKMILNIANGKLKFYTAGGRNFVHVKDVAQAIINCFNEDTNGKYYIIGNANQSYKDFFQVASKILQKPTPKIKIPNWGVKTFAIFGETVAKTTRKTPLLSYRMACISCENQFIGKDDLDTLNVKRTPIEVAVKDCYDWFTENNYL